MTRGPRRRNPLVRGYLRELDLALATVPSEPAYELRQQIVAHLDDTLPRRASAHEVAAVLNRLGAPGELAAEASVGTAPQPRPHVVLRRLGARLRRAGWQSWVLSVIFAVVLATGVGRLVQFLTAPLLQPGPSSGWYYSRDYSREVDTQVATASQTTVPIRSGQRQGIEMNIYNPSDFTETVLGLAPTSNPFGSPLRLLVSQWNPEVDIGGMVKNVFYGLPMNIAPHQYRMVLVKWYSRTCLAKGSEIGIDQIALRVRVGWLVHTDVIPLNQGFYVSGPSHGPCVADRSQR
jgi:HAAS domain-containing protein